MFASIFDSSVLLGIICSRRLQQTTFSDAFFLGALRVKNVLKVKVMIAFMTKDFNPIPVGNFVFLFNCTPVGRTSDSMMVPT